MIKWASLFKKTKVRWKECKDQSARPVTKIMKQVSEPAVSKRTDEVKKRVSETTDSNDRKSGKSRVALQRERMKYKKKPKQV